VRGGPRVREVDVAKRRRRVERPRGHARDGKSVRAGADRIVVFQEAALFPWLNVRERGVRLRLAGVPARAARTGAEYRSW
jgi:ABC-type taurine transport system ATPase subunit